MQIGDAVSLSQSGQQTVFEQRQRSGGVMGKEIEANLLPRLETLRLVDATEATFGGDSRVSSKQTSGTTSEGNGSKSRPAFHLLCALQQHLFVHFSFSPLSWLGFTFL